jgi:hypothetical protein
MPALRGEHREPWLKWSKRLCKPFLPSRSTRNSAPTNS